MSYDIILMHESNPVEVEPFLECGTQVDHRLDKSGNLYLGNNLAELNVPYNYHDSYKWLDKKEGIRWLDGRMADSTTERLEMAVLLLGSDRDRDIWKDTPGNAGFMLSILLKWANKHPDAIWKVMG